jgi:hypothetical protein
MLNVLNNDENKTGGKVVLYLLYICTYRMVSKCGALKTVAL